MSERRHLPGILAVYQSRGQILASEEGIATRTAEGRGEFGLGCPDTTGTVLSSIVLQPVPWGDEVRDG